MILPFVGGSYQMDARSFDHQRCVNMYAIASESGTSKSPAALRNVAGLASFAMAGTGAIRGGIESANRAFFVSGGEFYEVFEDGSATKRGDLLTFSGQCQLADNPTQVMIIDKTYGYIFNKTTNTFTQITDTDFPTPSSLTFQDGYFIVSNKDNAQVHISAINDGTSWGALDFTTVEASPDDLVAVVSNKTNLWAFGTKITEVYQNTGNATFPFQRISGAFIQTGCAAADTIKNLDNSLIWLGIDENGDSIVWRSQGYNAVRISTQAIERKIVSSSRFSESFAWTYHERGHAFYCLQVKGLDTTLVYDLSTGLWHERSRRNPNTNADEQHRGSCHVYAFNKHLVGDRQSGNIYEMSLSIYDDAGDPMVMRRITPHYDEEKRLISHAQIELDMEVGTGLNTGQGSNPQIMMRYSDDGGFTWSSELWRDIGKLGKYFTRVKWNRLGKSRDRVYDFSISDPVKIQINEAILNGS
mgnify:CR=1 FL=1